MTHENCSHTRKCALDELYIPHVYTLPPQNKKRDFRSKYTSCYQKTNAKTFRSRLEVKAFFSDQVFFKLIEKNN